MSDVGDLEMFDQAVGSLREVVPMWAQQIEMALGHSVDLVVDFDSLDRRFARVRPFVAQAITGALTAISQLGFDPDWKDAISSAVQRVVIRASDEGEACGAELSEGCLTVYAPLVDDGPPPAEKLAEAISRALAAAPTMMDELNAVPAFQGDPYQHAQRSMEKLEAIMRQGGFWPGEAPDGPIEVKGAFGCENMAFEQWLAWIFMPRVRDILAQRGAFPDGSSVGAYAIRELDGAPGREELIDVLIEFDDMVNALSSR
jgi:uncharacterized protein YqcC (DUF446 family)